MLKLCVCPSVMCCGKTVARGIEQQLVGLDEGRNKGQVFYRDSICVLKLYKLHQGFLLFDHLALELQKFGLPQICIQFIHQSRHFGRSQ